MSLPSGIIFINSDISPLVQPILESQLFIHETITGAVFDSRVDGYSIDDGYIDGYYADVVHNAGLRILVLRADFRDYTNRNLADAVVFVKSGQAIVEKTNYGSPGLSLPIYRLYIHQLLRYNGKIT